MQKRCNGEIKLTVLTTSFMMGMAGTTAFADATANDITSAITSGKAVVDLRVRTEIVDQDGVDDKANATTLRTRIGYMSESFNGLSGFFEFENTTALIDDYTYPAGPNAGKFPVVADPEGSEVNQAYLTYKQADLVTLILGRQRIIYDNARFVGNVGWRQNEQTYDAASLTTGIIPKSTLKYAYLTQINDIFGKSTELTGNLLNFNFTGFKPVSVSAYGYFLDYDKGTDSKTLGLSLNGKMKATEVLEVMYRAEYAQMSDYADNDSGNDAAYYNLEAGIEIKGVSASAGYEVLGGDGTTSFQTPLATKHAFNGWADKFLATPANGLVDTYLTIGGKLQGIKLEATYHMFSSDNDSKDYGSEIDLLAAKKFGKNYSGGIKYANYMADEFSVDTSKFWLWAGIAF